jgi:23S rRNA pseudouridine1911/1915/1917 synthase
LNSGCPRHALHARLLGFEHPATHENVLFESPLPADFQSLLTKWNIYTSAAKETKEN